MIALLLVLLGAAAGWICCCLYEGHPLPLLRRRRRLGDVYDPVEQQWEQRWHR